MFSVLVALLAIGSISATQLPVITQGPVNVTAVEDSTVNFLCEAEGNPTPDILIVRKTSEVGYTLPESSSSEGGESSEVSVFKSLNNIQREDEGWYVCIASNSQGRVTSEGYLKITSDLCEGVKCPNRKQCHADYTTMKAECRCKSCKDVEFQPLCGSDCQSYFNSCHLKSHSCDNGLGLSVLHKGQCKVEKVQLKVSRPTEQIFEGESISLKCEYSGFPAPSAFRWGKIMKNGKEKTVGTGKEYTVAAAEIKDSGKYWCIAEQCMKRVKSEVAVLEVLPRAVDTVEVKTCRVFGDPHIQTFDGQTYDFMGRCNYVMAVDCYMNKWMVLGQFTPCGDGVTCLEQITLYYGNMKPLTLARGWIVVQDGEKFRLRKNMQTVIGEAKVTYTGLSVEVALPDGVEIVYDGFWGVQITVDEKQVTCGLCGDNNGDMTNDLIGGRYGDTGNDIEVFGQSWAMWNSEWCGKEEPSKNDTCQNQEEIGERCDGIIQSDVFGECTAALRDNYFRESCIIDGCSTQVERFDGSPVCAVANSLAQICEVNGFNIPQDFLEKLDCGSKKEFQQAVYNSGCPIVGHPPFLDQ